MVDNSGIFIVLILLFVFLCLFVFIKDKLLVKKLKKIKVGNIYNNVHAFGEGVHYNVVVTEVNVLFRWVRFKLDEKTNLEDYNKTTEFSKDVIYHFQAKDFIKKFVG